jgi:hypothetical protein
MENSMATNETLNKVKWEHPSDYGGYSPDGAYVLATQTRDSHTLERSNYVRIFEDLRACAEKYDNPEWEEPSVYDFRAGHWAVGWVEYVIVKANAPTEVLELATEILDGLEDYGVYDEGHWSDLEFTKACDYWARASISERVEMIQQSCSSCSVFSARWDDFPQDDCGSLQQYLVTP